MARISTATKSTHSHRQIFQYKKAQRLLYHNEIPVDIVPFGAINHEGSIAWPPENSIKMSVIGFQEAYETTQIVTLSDNPALDVNVVTPQSLVLLKLTAWKDRCAQNTKDAQDLAFILLNYLDAGNNKRLYEEHQDWVENIDFDYEVSGARLLGHDLAALISEPTKLFINQLLEIETGQQNQYKLVEAMTHEKTRRGFEKNLSLLEALYLGLNEPKENSSNS